MARVFPCIGASAGRIKCQHPTHSSASLDGDVRTHIRLGMRLREAIARFTVRPDMRASLTMFFAGGALYLFGALVLGNRFVTIGGWLVAVFGVVKYVRWFFLR